MKKQSSLLLAVLLTPAAAMAQSSECIKQPTCTELGYTQSKTTCTTFGLKYVSCPFDAEKVACNGKVPNYATVKDACAAEGYKYTAAQCGTQGYDTTKSGSYYRQIGIPCPYSSSYYYCQYPNKNAQGGWYLCGDGTASSTTSGCKNRGYVIGVVIQAPTYRRNGIMVYTANGAVYTSGIDQWDVCGERGVISDSGASYLPGIKGSLRTVAEKERNLITNTYWSKISSELAYNGTSGTPIWSNVCWVSNGADYCKSSAGDRRSSDRGYILCVADF